MCQKTSPVQDPVFLINGIDFVGVKVLASKKYGGFCTISCALLPKHPTVRGSNRETEKCACILFT